MKDNQRKSMPIYSILRFFPLAIKQLARTIMAGQDQHIDGSVSEPKWDRDKSNQHMQSLTRHLTDYAEGEAIDDDGIPHLAKIAWRALAQLQMDEETNLEREAELEHDVERDIISGTEWPYVKSWGPYSDELEAEREKRMNIIGQNGNSGDHYDALKSATDDNPSNILH